MSARGNKHPPDSPPVRPPWRYRIAIRLLSPLLLLWVAVIAWQQARPKADANRFVRERLGFNTHRDRTSSRPRWLHAASVGEVLTALPLIQAAGPDSLLVTTTTATGAAVLHQRAPEVRHRYLPIDLPGAVQRFLNEEHPQTGWIVETEIWPWLFARARARNIPLTIVNARLSERTLKGAQRGLAPVYEDALRDVKVLARSDTDADRYRDLGARSVSVIGDLKRAAPLSDVQPTPLLDTPYHLAASTHDDEETRLAQAWIDSGTDALLVIAPRHPERGEKLQKQLSDIAGSHVARRAADVIPDVGDRLYLADTLGEMDAWYAHAATVFVGGSLIARGGHNLMEPARAGRAIASGPHTDNFKQVTADLLSENALFQAPDAASIVSWMLQATDSTQGMRARQVAERDATVLQRYLDALGESDAKASRQAD